MIDNVIKRDEILNSFPGILSTDLDEIYFNVLPHFVFYETISKNKKDCFCTHCKTNYIESPNERIYTNINSITHNAEGTCIKCKHPITYRCANKGRGVLKGRRNICIFSAVGDELYIRCFVVHYYFPHNEDIPEIDTDERHRYYLSKEGCQHWKFAGYKETKWQTVYSENEPTFSAGMFVPADNSYVIINPDKIYKTFLKYSELEQYYVSCGNRTITYLCFYAKHPNIEYLMKTGFDELVLDRIEGTSRGRINWKSNDVKRMLGLNKQEFMLLSEKGSNAYWKYKEIRRLTPEYSVSWRWDLFERYGNNLTYMIKIRELTDFNFKQIINYADKQQKARTSGILIDWKDYLEDCVKLNYNIKDSAISKPTDIYEAKKNIRQIIADLQNQKINFAIKEREKELQEWIMTHDGLTIVVPKSVNDIIREGRIQNHCVGGYCDKHANGLTNILFLRKLKQKSKPYYTMEISKTGQIIQCRGYNNNRNKEKTKDVIDFEVKYQKFLNAIFRKKSKKITENATDNQMLENVG